MNTPEPLGFTYFMIKVTFVNASSIFFYLIQTQFSKTIKIECIDNGIKFFSLKSFFLSKGIIRKTSVIHLNKMGRLSVNIYTSECCPCLKYLGFFTFKILSECVKIAVYLINRTPSSLLHGKTPWSFSFLNPLIVLT